MIPSNDGTERVEFNGGKNEQYLYSLEDDISRNKRLKFFKKKNDTLKEASDMLKKLKFAVIDSDEKKNELDQAYEKFSELILDKLRKLIKNR